MEIELAAIVANDTWDDVDALPSGRMSIGFVWTFTKKMHEIPVRYKARLCAQGFSQVHGYDYFETFSPVIRQTSIRIILSIAAAEDMVLHQMDVNSAFLHGKIDTEIYMKATPELNRGPNSYVRLRKALYGLKQASRIWNSNINSFFSTRGFKRSEVEPCIYILHRNGAKVIVGVYVDDLIIAGTNDEIVQWIKAELSAAYPMKDLGPIRHLVGMQVCRGRGYLDVSQSKYIQTLLERFHMLDEHGVYTPMVTSEKICADMSAAGKDHHDDDGDVNSVPYRQLLGAL